MLGLKLKHVSKKGHWNVLVNENSELHIGV